MRFALRAAVGLILVAILAAGCKHSSNGAPGGPTSAGELKTFPVRGKVVSVDAAKGSIMLDNEAVPGFMDAMTMPYQLKNPSITSELHPGDMITATILARKVDDEYQDVVLDDIVITAQARPDNKPTVQYHIPTAGDAVPDFKLTNEDGRAIHLAQFKGRVLLLTFVYTRCPLPDYCIRMSRNFAQIDKALRADPALYTKTHLLSISFDPKVDTPAVLKSYGETYIGGDAKRTFAHWDFAVPSAPELAALTQFFDVGITPGEGGTLTHSLSTALIGKDGRVREWYPTNEWTPDEVLAAMKSAAAA
ncbi:MAG: SCO family protein [Acidobacteriaceae bacterium]